MKNRTRQNSPCNYEYKTLCQLRLPPEDKSLGSKHAENSNGVNKPHYLYYTQMGCLNITENETS